MVMIRSKTSRLVVGSNKSNNWADLFSGFLWVASGAVWEDDAAGEELCGLSSKKWVSFPRKT
jgi:hypothetical protein